MARLSEAFRLPSAAEVAAANLAAAVSLARAGIAVFPIQSEGREAKTPCHGLGSWKIAATTDERRIAEWWARWPTAMPAVALGKSGLLAIDLDVGDGKDGRAAWEAVRQSADGPRVLTPSGGVHVIFRQPPTRRPFGNGEGALKGQGVNVRGEGGYIAGAGSIRADHGGAYVLEAGTVADLLAAPVVPDWLAELLEPPSPERPAIATPMPAPTIAADNPRLKAYVEQAFADELTGVSTCPAGGRNNQLNLAAFALGQMVGAGWVGEDEVRQALVSAAEACGLVHDDGMQAALKTIRSGIGSGRRQPRKVPDEWIADEAEAAQGAAIARRLTRTRAGDVIDEATGEILDEAPPVPGMFPDALTRVPGLVGQIVDYIDATLETPSRPLSLLAAIAITGTIIARHWAAQTAAFTTYSNIYLVGLCRSGFGKTTVINQARGLIVEAVDPGKRYNTSGFLGGEDIASSAGFRREMEDCPARLFTNDEFGDFVRGAHAARAGAHQREIMTMLLKFYSAAPSIYTGVAYAASRSKPIPNPCALVLGYSTVDSFWDGFTFENVRSGLLPRFLVLHERAALSNADVGDTSAARDAVLGGIRDILDRRARDKPLKAGNMSGEFPADPTLVPLTPEAEALRREARVAEKRMATELEEARNPAYAIWNRLTESALKLALIRAVGINHHTPIIEAADLEWGLTVARWIMQDTITTLSTRGLVGSEAERQQRERVERLEMIIAERRSQGTITRMQMYNRLKHHGMKPRDIDDLIEMEVQAGLLELQPGSKHKASWVYAIKG